MKIFDAFKASPQLSIKYDNYFKVYEDNLRRFVGKKITFIEIGVLNGGSLFMWRKFFGKKARIIGIDLNPEAKKWEKYGFEIIIGDQSDATFWDKQLKNISDIDVLLDDGGHSNLQQIVTTEKAIKKIKDGGMVIIEDTHSNYMSSFGNPSRYSFIAFTKKIIDAVHQRSYLLKLKEKKYSSLVYSLQFYDSIVVMNIDRKLCKKSKLLQNKKGKLEKDYRYHKAQSRYKTLARILTSNQLTKKIAVSLYYKIQSIRHLSKIFLKFR
jgi:hypothetical protein